jgi:hypothetical protein
MDIRDFLKFLQDTRELHYHHVGITPCLSWVLSVWLGSYPVVRAFPLQSAQAPQAEFGAAQYDVALVPVSDIVLATRSPRRHGRAVKGAGSVRVF